MCSLFTVSVCHDTFLSVAITAGAIFNCQHFPGSMDTVMLIGASFLKKKKKNNATQDKYSGNICSVN